LRGTREKKTGGIGSIYREKRKGELKLVALLYFSTVLRELR
jgi:hypothetical protein